MELSQNENIEDPVLSQLIASMSFANYFNKILRKIELEEYIDSIKESIMPIERKQTFNIILTSIGVVKEVKNIVEDQIKEMFPDLPIEIISKTLKEHNGNLENTVLALSEINPHEPKKEEVETKEDAKIKKFKERVEGEERLRAQRRKEIEEEDKRARAEKDEEMFALNEASIRKTKELAAKYMYDDDDDEFSELVNQESTNLNSKEIEDEGKEETKKEEVEPVKEVKKEMTQKEREYANKKKKIDKARRKFNKSKQSTWAKKN